jgi:hypothetical protein
MKFESIVLSKNDMVMVHHNVGGMPQKEVNQYCSKLMKHLTTLFGKGRVAFFPVREGETWDFTVVSKST